MKTSDLRRRLRKSRPMTSITIRVPADVLRDLKRIAPLLGFLGYQPLIRAYIGDGLRRDLEKVRTQPDLEHLLQSLRRHGVTEEVITSAIADLKTA
jgi:hypothetical protein